MDIRQERINTAFNLLRADGVVHTQRDLAQLMGYQYATVSKALKGHSLTDNFIKVFK